MVEQGEDAARVDNHADSDRDKADAHDGEGSGRRVEPAPHIVVNTGRTHEKSTAVALGTPQGRYYPTNVCNHSPIVVVALFHRLPPAVPTHPASWREQRFLVTIQGVSGIRRDLCGGRGAARA